MSATVLRILDRPEEESDEFFALPVSLERPMPFCFEAQLATPSAVDCTLTGVAFGQTKESNSY